MNFINSHNDNIIISKLLLYFNQLKNFLIDLLDINKDIVQYPKVEDQEFNLRKEYKESDVKLEKDNNSKLFFYIGLILIIGGISFITYQN
jgi:hypothetical protein